jgi:hypothetical protein
MANRGLPHLSGGIAARERDAWASPCVLHKRKGVERPAAGVIETLSGPMPICAECIPQGERLGYTVRREPLA